MKDRGALEFAIAGLQFVAATADGATIATSISHGSSERRLLRIPAEGTVPELLLSENAWLYRPLLATGSHRVVFGRRNDRASVYVVEVSP